MPVHVEGGRYRHRRRLLRQRRSATDTCAIRLLRTTSRIKKIVDPLSFEGLMDQPEVRRVVDNSNSRREFGIAFVVENVSSGQARRKQGCAHHLIPIEAQARL